MLSNIVLNDISTTTPVGLFKNSIARNADFNILVIGDSTGNDAGDWPRLFINWLASKYNTHTTKHYAFNIANNSYDTPSIISTGSGALSINLYNYCIAGARPTRSIGYEHTKAISDLSLDLIMWNHGQNVYGGLTNVHYIGEFFSAFEETRRSHPQVPTGIVLQNPRRDTDYMASVIDSLKYVAPYYGNTIDVYSEFLALSKDPSLYFDDIHPNDTGSTIYLNSVKTWWNSTLPTPNPALTSVHSNNHLLNGDFSDWTGTVPTNWEAISGVAVNKDTSIIEESSAYSAKLVGGLGMQQRITNTLRLDNLRGRTVFCCVRQYVPNGMNNTTGRIYLRYFQGATSTTYTTRALTYGIGRFCWQMLGPVVIPSDVTEVRVMLYTDTSTLPTSTVYYDRAILVDTNKPRDMS